MWVALSLTKFSIRSTTCWHGLFVFINNESPIHTKMVKKKGSTPRISPVAPNFFLMEVLKFGGAH